MNSDGTEGQKNENYTHLDILVTGFQSTKFNQYWQKCGIHYNVHLFKSIERRDGKLNE